MTTVATHEQSLLLDGSQLDLLLVGSTITGVVVDADVDTLRLRLADGRRWVLAVHLLDLARFGTVAGVDRFGDELRLIDADGEDLVAIVDQPTPAASWDRALWLGTERDLLVSDEAVPAVARAVMEAPEVVVRIGIGVEGALTDHTAAVRGDEAVWVTASDGGTDVEVVAFRPVDLAARVLEVGGLFDPASFQGTVDLLITVPGADGRTRVTVLAWAGSDGVLSSPDAGGTDPLDPAALTAEIAEALRRWSAEPAADPEVALS